MSLLRSSCQEPLFPAIALAKAEQEEAAAARSHARDYAMQEAAVFASSGQRSFFFLFFFLDMFQFVSLFSSLVLVLAVFVAVSLALHSFSYQGSFSSFTRKPVYSRAHYLWTNPLSRATGHSLGFPGQPFPPPNFLPVSNLGIHQLVSTSQCGSSLSD